MIKASFSFSIFLVSFFTNLYAYPPESISLPYNTGVVSADLNFKRAKVLQDSGQYQEAIEYYEISAGKYENLEEWEKYIKTLSNIGESYINSHKFDKAQNALQQSLLLALKYLDKTHFSIAEIYLKMGAVCANQGAKSRAIKYQQKALEIWSKTLGENHPYVASCYNNMGNAFMDLGNYPQALKHHQKALDIRLKVFGKYHPHVALCYYNLGCLYRNQGDYPRALECHQIALEIRRKIFGKNHPDVATSFNSLGNVYLYQGDYSSALDYYQKTLKIWLNTLDDDNLDMGIVYINMGNLYLLLGNYYRSSRYYQKALDIRIKILGPDHPSVARVYNGMGLAFRDQSDYSRALEYHQKALSVMLKVLRPDHPLVAKTYGNIGTVYWYLEDYSRALSYHQRALSTRIKVLGPNHLDVATSYGEIAYVYLRMGDYTRTLEYLLMVLEIKSNIQGENHPGVAKIYESIGFAYAKQNDYSRALEYYQKALDSRLKQLKKYHPHTALSYLNIGNIYNDQGRYRQALAYYQKAFTALVKDFDTLNIYVNPLLKAINSKTEMLDLLFKKAQLAEKFYSQTKNSKDLNLSFETSLLAADLIDSMRNDNSSVETKLDLAKNSVKIYETGIRTARKLYQLTGKEDYLFKAFNIAERSKSYLLLQSLKETEAKSFANIPDSLLEQERDLKIEIAFYEKQRFEAENEKDSTKVSMYQNYLFDKKTAFRQLTEQLEKEFPDYYKLKYDTRVASVKDIRDKLIDDHTAFIEYFWGDSAVYVFTVTKKDLQLKEIKQPLALREKIDSLRSLLMTPPDALHSATYRDRFTSLSRELYQILMPEENTLAGIEKLIIIPDGPLSYLPFDMLLTQSPTSKDRYSTLPYLIRDYDVSYGYSATLLQQNAEKPNRIDNTRCLAFAPSYEGKESNLATRGVLNTLRGKNYTALPGAQREVERLSGYLEGEFHFGQSATEENFKQEAKNYGILHLAMHGTSDSARSGDSKLIFTQSKGSKEDGLLHTYELYNLKLNAEMAVLSACQSGTGQYVKGEGVISLARGFMYAGVRSVIMTLWDADDKSSAALTDAFYGSLLGGSQKDQALREAKLHYLNTSNDRLSHPFYWAGYSAFGDMRPMQDKRINYTLISLIAGLCLFLISGMVVARKRKLRKVKKYGL